MKPRANTTPAQGDITIAIPMSALAGMMPDAITLPPPRLVWTDSAPEIIRIATGMERPAFVDALRIMEADVHHREHVIRLSAKRRGVEVENFVAFLSARFAGTSRAKPSTRGGGPANDATAEEPRSGVDEVIALVGGERVPERVRAGRGRR